MIKELLIIFSIVFLHVPTMPETVREYMTRDRKPEMTETIQEYIDRGRERSILIDDIYARSNSNFEYIDPAEVEYIEVPEDGMIFYSGMELTAYMWTGNPCADGVYPQVGYTVACNDPNLWHKWVYIEGHGTYYVHDTGGMSSNVIDIYVGDYDSAVQFGRQSAEVYIVE